MSMVAAVQRRGQRRDADRRPGPAARRWRSPRTRRCWRRRARGRASSSGRHPPAGSPAPDRSCVRRCPATPCRPRAPCSGKPVSVAISTCSQMGRSPVGGGVLDEQRDRARAGQRRAVGRLEGLGRGDGDAGDRSGHGRAQRIAALGRFTAATARAQRASVASVWGRMVFMGRPRTEQEDRDRAVPRTTPPLWAYRTTRPAPSAPPCAAGTGGRPAATPG